MSDAAEAVGGSGGADRPCKKQKRDETEAAMLMARLGGPMEDEATARKKLRDAGFDPDSPQLLQTRTLVEVDGSDFDNYHIPMTHFCRVGDLKMCRYLLSKGAFATQAWNDDEDADDVNIMPSPMVAAAQGGQVHICKWLCEHGGRGDIRLTNNYYFSPLCNALMFEGLTLHADSARIRRQRETYRWLIMNEALCPHEDGNVDKILIGEAFWSEGAVDEGPHVLGWAEGAVQTYDGFMMFLMGTSRREMPAFSRDRLAAMLHTKFRSIDSVDLVLENLSQDQQLLLWNNEQKRDTGILQCLAGHPGIRQSIADMLGVVRGRDLCILRQLGPKLRSYFEEVRGEESERRLGAFY